MAGLAEVFPFLHLLIYYLYANMFNDPVVLMVPFPLYKLLTDFSAISNL